MSDDFELPHGAPFGTGYSGSAPSPQAVSASGEYPSRGLIVKPFEVSVQGYGEGIYYAQSRSKALSAAYRQFTSLFGGTFKDFLRMVRVQGIKPTGHFGAPITVSGKPAFYVSGDSQYIRFVRPDSDVVLISHPLDVEPEHYRPPYYRDAKESTTHDQ